MFDIENLRRIRFGLFILFAADLFITGSGVVLPGAPFPLRKLLFALFGLSCVLTYLADPKPRKDLLALLLGVALFFACWVLVVPSLRQGAPALALADAAPLMGVAVFLLSHDLSRNERHWQLVSRFLLVALWALALFHIVLYGLLRLWPELHPAVSGLVQGLLDSGSGLDAKYVFIIPLSDGTSRIYFGSSFLLLVGLYLSLKHPQGPVINLKSVLGVAVFGLAIFATNTRSIMFGTIVLLGISLLSRLHLHLQLRDRTPTVMAYFALLLLPFLVGVALIPTVDPALLQSLNMDRPMSDDLRSMQLVPLWNAFMEHPLMGQGFGASAALIRSEVAPYAYELSTLALLMKIGVLGFVAVCALAACVLHRVQSGAGTPGAGPLMLLYALYFALVIICFYNPYAFGFYGTLFLLILAYEFSALTGATQK